MKRGGPSESCDVQLPFGRYWIPLEASELALLNIYTKTSRFLGSTKVKCCKHVLPLVAMVGEICNNKQKSSRAPSSVSALYSVTPILNCNDS